MTTLAILADIHGNRPALEAVLADLARWRVDHVVVAGDVINWGPFSAQVLERVASEGWAVIRGNNEYYLLDYQTPRMPAAWRDYTLLPWLKRQFNARWHAVIAAWPDTLSLRFPDGPPIRVVHGSPRDNTQSIYRDSPEADVAAWLAGVEETTVVAAHTHLPMDRRAGRWRVLNPGSVGVPLDGAHRASYLLLESDGRDWRAAFRSVPFDPAPVLDEFERQGFVDEYGITAQLVVEEFAQARLRLHPFRRWRADRRPGAPVTPELLAEFATIDPWPYIPAAYHVNR